MAQTIASRVGSVSCNWSSSSFVTLFTVSSGTARVILNSIECSNNNEGASGQIWIYLGNSALGNRTPIWPMSIPTGTTNVACLPGNAAGPSPSYIGVRTGDGGVGFANIPPNGIGFTVSNAIFCPRDFYMNTNDTLYIRGVWSSPSGICLYNFTTITET